MNLPQNKDELVSHLHEGIDDASRKIDELRVQARLAEAELKQAIDSRIQKLEATKQDLKNQVNHLKHASTSAVEDLRKGCQTSWELFKKSVDEAVNEFKS